MTRGVIVFVVVSSLEASEFRPPDPASACSATGEVDGGCSSASIWPTSPVIPPRRDVEEFQGILERSPEPLDPAVHPWRLRHSPLVADAEPEQGECEDS